MCLGNNPLLLLFRFSLSLFIFIIIIIIIIIIYLLLLLLFVLTCFLRFLIARFRYPNSTGLREVHYRITDPHADPINTTQKFSEQLLRLPHFLCYTPYPLPAPPVRYAYTQTHTNLTPH